MVACALVAPLCGCGQKEPSALIESLGSDAATARLVIAERAADAVPERYAARVLEQVATSAGARRRTLAAAPLDHGLKARALAGAAGVANAADDARRDRSRRTAAAARLDSLAHALEAMADAIRGTGS